MSIESIRESYAFHQTITVPAVGSNLSANVYLQFLKDVMEDYLHRTNIPVDDTLPIRALIAHVDGDHSLAKQYDNPLKAVMAVLANDPDKKENPLNLLIVSYIWAMTGDVDSARDGLRLLLANAEDEIDNNGSDNENFCELWSILALIVGVEP